jgi:hypothetical protein
MYQWHRCRKYVKAINVNPVSVRSYNAMAAMAGVAANTMWLHQWHREISRCYSMM